MASVMKSSTGAVMLPLHLLSRAIHHRIAKPLLKYCNSYELCWAIFDDCYCQKCAT